MKDPLARYQINDTIIVAHSEQAREFAKFMEFVEHRPQTIRVETSWRNQAYTGFVEVDKLQDGHEIIEHKE